MYYAFLVHIGNLSIGIGKWWQGSNQILFCRKTAAEFVPMKLQISDADARSASGLRPQLLEEADGVLYLGLELAVHQVVVLTLVESQDMLR